MDSMRKIINAAVIEPAAKADFEPFAGLHYRSGKLPVVDKVFALRLPRYGRVGIIVYSFAPAHLRARRLALGKFLPQKPARSEMMDFINNNIRSISRVVILPEFRGVGLGSFLVKNTLDKTGVKLIESVAAMGKANSFLERAQMTKFIPHVSERRKSVAAVLKNAGLTEQALLNPDLALEHINRLCSPTQRLLWRKIDKFNAAYGKKRLLTNKREKLALTLSKLSAENAYFYWIRGENRSYMAYMSYMPYK